MEGQQFVIANGVVRDPDSGKRLYGGGDKVPMDDAIRLGLVAAPTKKAAKATKRARKSSENRARKLSEDR